MVEGRFRFTKKTEPIDQSNQPKEQSVEQLREAINFSIGTLLESAKIIDGRKKFFYSVPLKVVNDWKDRPKIGITDEPAHAKIIAVSKEVKSAAEKWALLRLEYSHAEPRIYELSTGNVPRLSLWIRNRDEKGNKEEKLAMDQEASKNTLKAFKKFLDHVQNSSTK